MGRILAAHGVKLDRGRLRPRPVLGFVSPGQAKALALTLDSR